MDDVVPGVALSVAVLERIAFLLERALEPSYRVKAFRGAAATVRGLDDDDLRSRVADATLTELAGIGPKTAAVVTAVVEGRTPDYLADTEQRFGGPLTSGGAELRAALRGDLHLHSDWSDGGSPILEMAETAEALGHEYAALTDHSPRLTVAHGLTAERLERQLDVVAELNAELAPFRLLTGIECDIHDDGRLDQSDELLGRVDIVVASVHSKLTMPSADMTRRMVAAIANPHTDVLGHCTGRNVAPRGRGKGPRGESEFDAEIVFEACKQFGVAVEINSRPERRDPPRRLIRLAVQTGCLFSIDTDAHAPGQLDFQILGAERAMDCDVTAGRVVNTWALEDLLAWTRT